MARNKSNSRGLELKIDIAQGNVYDSRKYFLPFRVGLLVLLAKKLLNTMIQMLSCTFLNCSMFRTGRFSFGLLLANNITSIV